MRVSSIDRLPRRTSRVPGSRERSAKREHLVVADGALRRSRARIRARQLLEGERLDEVVVGAGVEAGHPVVDRRPGGEHQDRGVVAGLAEPPAHLEPVHAGHGHVQHDGVSRALGVGTKRGRPVLGELGLVALEPQGAIERLAHRRFVVDHQHSHPSSLTERDEKALNAGGRGGFVPPVPAPVVFASPMSRVLIERRLMDVAQRLKRAREELAVIDDQLAALSEAADEARIRSLVSETSIAHREYTEAQRHADAMARTRQMVRPTWPSCRRPRTSCSTG